MDTPLPLSRWLKHLRTTHDWTQETLAEQVGCSPDMIRAIEGGRRRPSRAMAERLADVLHIASDQRAAFLRAARTNNGSVDAPASTAPPAVPPLGAPRLVVPPTVLIGRARELDAVCALLADPACRLVTVLGPGGMGKTRLAVQVADALHAQFADGVVVVALAPLTAPEEVVTAIATYASS
jgi:transcriptional regulator with XRE-family HTH domain